MCQCEHARMCVCVCAFNKSESNQQLNYTNSTRTSNSALIYLLIPTPTLFIICPAQKSRRTPLWGFINRFYFLFCSTRFSLFFVLQFDLVSWVQLLLNWFFTFSAYYSCPLLQQHLFSHLLRPLLFPSTHSVYIQYTRAPSFLDHLICFVAIDFHPALM